MSLASFPVGVKVARHFQCMHGFFFPLGWILCFFFPLHSFPPMEHWKEKSSILQVSRHLTLSLSICSLRSFCVWV
ncbi:uncharacterized protein BP01DRAFT_103310 [Aspergillus saccharolyticus JOP 1030-1]|uniref:Uncharacterized protein n=1 Tax=Aspergillus saccharolyticus JOP 1030-1 TaxID=1450539 RepID=A0A318Z8A9_9EURO|nr:hypothetical protein BP01DRAFT_103310 [Aspergillus saccharolyticus JOP 1030-1]PYH43389.1 hypothetical protein BP01DRAFT_103310 [Aspergillus saccharolyticus JOP 1030-1]